MESPRCHRRLARRRRPERSESQRRPLSRLPCREIRRRGAQSRQQRARTNGPNPAPQRGPAGEGGRADGRPRARLSPHFRSRQFLHPEQGQRPPDRRRCVKPPRNRLARNHGEHGAAPAKKSTNEKQYHLGHVPRSRRSQKLSLAQPVPDDPQTRSRRTASSPTYRAGARSQHVHIRHGSQPELDPDLAVHDCLKRSVPLVSFHVGCGARPGRAVDMPSWSPT
jgi:hypothetical protein